MSDLRTAAQQALEALETNQYAVADQAPHRDVMAYNATIEALRAALAKPVQAWHFIDCEGECLACLIEREVKATYGNQGLAYLRRHVGDSNDVA